jgi:hypothetical protein
VVLPETVTVEAEYGGAAVTMVEMVNEGEVPLHLRARVLPPETLEEERAWYVVSDSDADDGVCKYVDGAEKVSFELDGDHSWDWMMTAPFPFLGRDVSMIYVSLDGYVSLGMPKLAIIKPEVGGVSSAGLIAPFMADLVADGLSSVYAHRCGIATEIYWDNMVALATARRVSFGLTIYSNGVIQLRPPTDGAHGLIGMEGSGGESLWSRAADQLVSSVMVTPWLRMSRWTEEPLHNGEHELPLVLMADNVLSSGGYSNEARVTFDLVTDDMQCIAATPVTVEVVNKHSSGPPPSSGGGHVLPVCSPDESVAPSDEAVSCKLVAALCPSYCTVETPSPTPEPVPCKDQWSKTKCKKQATTTKCKKNAKVKKNCQKTCGLCD